MRLCGLLLLILCAVSVFANELPCQYPQTEFYEEIVPQLHDLRTDEVLGPALIFDNFGKSPDTYAVFQAHNPLDRAITIEINYTQIVSSGLTGTSTYDSSQIVTIPQNSYVTLKNRHGFGPQYSNYIDPESIKYVLVDPPGILQNDRVIKNKTICLFNDGASCTNDDQCGGKYCVQGYCSNSEFCFKNDCKCPPDKVQCSDNKRCVPKGVVPVDSVPLCNNREECETGYLNEEDKCAKSPSVISAELLAHKQETREKWVYILIF